jgi:hypothetical protein
MNATEPTTLTATYDKRAIAEFRTLGDGCLALGEAPPQDGQGNPTAPLVRVIVRLVKYRLRPDGTAERSPHRADVRSFEIADLYAQAATNPEWADVLTRLTMAVAGYAASVGAL